MQNKYRLITVSIAPSGARIFTWRNYLRSSPIIEQQSDAPLVIRNPRFYSNWSWRYWIGTWLEYDVVNVSQKAIYSFAQSQYSAELWDTGATINQPESALQPGESIHTRISVSGKSKVRLTVDFVQFADGTTWYSDVGQKIVHPDGVHAGAQAAADHLIKILELAGPAAVLTALPRIHADVNDKMATCNIWGSGFFCGVTNVIVRVQHANREGGLSEIEGALWRTLDELSKRSQNGSSSNPRFSRKQRP